jgi:response regulator aspartate phosphatase I
MGESETVANAKISSADIPDLLNAWYLRILKNDGEGAFDYKDKVDELIPNIEIAEDLKYYYSLLSYKHDSTFKSIQNQKAEMVFDHSLLNTSLEEIDNLLSYYFYLNKGTIEFNKKNLTTAINYYAIAELKLRNISNEIEMALYHYRMAKLYYQVSQTLFSVNHTKKAQDIFKGYDNFDKYLMGCKQLLGANYLDIEEYELAEKFFLKALKDCTRFKENILVSSCFHNLALVYSRQNKAEKSIDYINKALESKEYSESGFYIRSLYMLASEYNKINRSNTDIIQKGIEYCKENNNIEYEIKFKIEKLISNKIMDKTIFDNHLMEMEQHHLFLDIEFQSKNISNYFKKHGDLEKACYFLEKALHSRNKQMQKEVRK